jgi:hypothetical protein
MLSAYESDRRLWNDSVKEHAGLQYTTWHFSDHSIHIGPQNIPLHSNLIIILATFDVFCSSSMKDVSGSTTSSTRERTYYLLLQKAIASELEVLSKRQKILYTTPKCMDPWLWRTAQGYFHHDDDDDEAVKYHGGSSYDQPFPSLRKCITFSALTSV